MAEENETRTSIMVPDGFLKQVRIECINSGESVGRALGKLAMIGSLSKACFVVLSSGYGWEDSKTKVVGGTPKRDLLKEMLKKQNLSTAEAYQWLQDLKNVKENAEILMELLEEMV